MRALPEDNPAGPTSREALRLGFDTTRAPAFLALAHAAYTRRDLDAACDAAYLALSCDRTSFDAWMIFGAVSAQHGAYAQARLCFSHVLAAQAEHLGALTGLGETLIALKDFSGAAQAFARVVQHDPAGAHPAGLRARMLLLCRPQWKLGLQALAR